MSNIGLGDLIAKNTILEVKMFGEGSTGTGTVTEVNTGEGLTGGPITTSGTISLATVDSNTLLSNILLDTATPVPNTISDILDATIGSDPNRVVFRNSEQWASYEISSGSKVFTIASRDQSGSCSFTNITANTINSGNNPVSVNGHANQDQYLISSATANNLVSTNAAGQTQDSGYSVVNAIGNASSVTLPTTEAVVEYVASNSSSPVDGVTLVSSLISSPSLRYINATNNTEQNESYSNFTSEINGNSYIFVGINEPDYSGFCRYYCYSLNIEADLALPGTPFYFSTLIIAGVHYLFIGNASGISVFYLSDNLFLPFQFIDLGTSEGFNCLGMTTFTNPNNGTSYLVTVNGNYQLCAYVFIDNSFQLLSSTAVQDSKALSYFYSDNKNYICLVNRTQYLYTYYFDGSTFLLVNTVFVNNEDGLNDVTNYSIDGSIYASTVDINNGLQSNFVWNYVSQEFVFQNSIICPESNTGQTLYIKYAQYAENHYLFCTNLIEGSFTTLVYSEGMWEKLGSNYYCTSYPTQICLTFYELKPYLLTGSSNTSSLFFGILNNTLRLSERFYVSGYLQNSQEINSYPIYPDFSDFTINTITQNNSSYSCEVTVSLIIVKSLAGKLLAGAGDTDGTTGVENLSEITPKTGNGITCVRMPFTFTQTVLRGQYLLLKTEGDIIVSNVTTQVNLLPLNVT
jgi:hypothetical protein